MISAKLHRREFIRRAGCVALSTTGILSTLGHRCFLHSVSPLASAEAAADY